MDLSRFKWPIIILIVVGVFWLLSMPGVNYMHKKFASTVPGQDAKADARSEAGLSWLGNYMLKTFRYSKALDIFEDCSDLFPDEKNFLYNQHSMAKCYEKLGDIETTLVILDKLYVMDAKSIDNRLPSRDALKLRIDKLQEMHGLGEIR